MRKGQYAVPKCKVYGHNNKTTKKLDQLLFSNAIRIKWQYVRVVHRTNHVNIVLHCNLLVARKYLVEFRLAS